MRSTTQPVRRIAPIEWFLNPDRVTMPDIDVDFEDARRDEVIAYVTRKYGTDHVAQIITFGTMLARAAIRDVGRVLGFGYGEVDRIGIFEHFWGDTCKSWTSQGHIRPGDAVDGPRQEQHPETGSQPKDEHGDGIPQHTNQQNWLAPDPIRECTPQRRADQLHSRIN